MAFPTQTVFARIPVLKQVLTFGSGSVLGTFLLESSRANSIRSFSRGELDSACSLKEAAVVDLVELRLVHID